MSNVRRFITMQEFILVLALLTVESSYKSEIERPTEKVPDTTQFWFGAQGPWRIRTYAMDHDIHVYSMAPGANGSALTQEGATAHIAMHYGEVLDKQYIIRFKNPADAEEVTRVLRLNGLPGTLEVAPAGFAFYNPDGAKYKTQSTPK